MGKNKSQSPIPGKVTLVMFQLEGDSSTLEERFRTFKEVMNRSMPQNHRRQVPSPSANAALPSAPEDMDSEEAAEVFENGDIIDAPSSPTSSVGKPKRKLPTMSLVKELDLRPEGKPHLKAFLDEKRPKDQNEKIAVCLYYLRRILQIENVTANHVYTCMDDAKVRSPNDLPQTIRNIANRKGWIDASSSSALEITTKGINLVQHDLPHGGD